VAYTHREMKRGIVGELALYKKELAFSVYVDDWEDFYEAMAKQGYLYREHASATKALPEPYNYRHFEPFVVYLNVSTDVAHMGHIAEKKLTITSLRYYYEIHSKLLLISWRTGMRIKQEEKDDHTPHK